MGSVYSQVLWEHAATSGSPVSSGAVPAGFVWVVRDIRLYFPKSGTWNVNLGGIEIYDDAGLPLIWLESPFALAGRDYGRQMHQVLETADHLHAFPQEAGWQWRISGYQLTLP